MRRLALLAAGLAVFCLPGIASAWHLSGRCFCDGNGLPLGGVTIQVTSTDGQGFVGTGTTDETGAYFVSLPNLPGCFRATPLLGAGESVLSPASGSFDFCTTFESFDREFIRSQ